MLKILVLSFYYEPDLSAGSFRAKSFVNQLAQNDVEIDLITTEPNRYSSFKPSAPEVTEVDRVRVRRLSMPGHKSGMLDQIFAFLVYYAGARKLVRKTNYDLVFATSSRLFTAFLGARIAKKKGAPLYLDVRDIFTDTVKDILPRPAKWLITPFISIIEKYTFGSAKHINLVSEGFSGYFKVRYPGKPLSFFTNGIDNEFLKAPAVATDTFKIGKKLRVLYAGNIGDGQGLHTIIPELARQLRDRVEFKIIGDGGQRIALERSIEKFGLDNVQLLQPIARDQLVDQYRSADVLFLHLNDYPAFTKVLPSKIFEYAAMGKPIWAGLNGYSAQFAKSEIDGCQVFLPSDVGDAIDKLENLDLGTHPRFTFNRRFGRENIMKRMATEVLMLSGKFSDE